MVRGSLNCTPSFVEAAVYHAVMAASSIDIPQTGGALRPITVVTKPGTVVHVVMPHASSMRGVTGYRISDVMNGALAQLVPDRVPAAGEGGSTLALFTGRVDGEPFVYNELVVGTWGGRPVATATTASRTRARRSRTCRSRWRRRSGRSSSSATASSPTPAAPGATAAGSRSSGSGGASCPDTALHVRSDRQVHRPYGLAGGQPGAASSNLIVRANGDRRAAAADVRGGAAAGRRLPPPDGGRRRLGRSARARSRSRRPRRCE